MSSFTFVLVAVHAYDDLPPFLNGANDSYAPGIVTDINTISQHWGQISPYRDNQENYFGVQDVGLPDGCQVEQVHSLQRHAQRFPTSSVTDGTNNENFAAKLANFTAAHPRAELTGPLSFLNGWSYIMGESYLTGIGASTEFESGVTFW